MREETKTALRKMERQENREWSGENKETCLSGAVKMPEQALAALKRTAANYRRKGEAGRLQLAETLIQMARLEGQQKAIAHYEEALSVLHQSSCPETTGTMITLLKQKGSLHYEMQHYQEAGQCFEAALSLSEKYTGRQSEPIQLEAAAIATLAAAIRMEAPDSARAAENRRRARQLINLAEQYLEGVGAEGDYLINKQLEGLTLQKAALKEML